MTHEQLLYNWLTSDYQDIYNVKSEEDLRDFVWDLISDQVVAASMVGDMCAYFLYDVDWRELFQRLTEN